MDVDQSAPVWESDHIVIGAAADVVWDALSDFRSWPLWMPGVKSVQVDGPIQPGTRFEWKAGPGTIRSEILESDRPRSIGWKGRTFGITALHVWRMEEQGGSTRAFTEESWDGLLARVLRASMSKKVSMALQDGLAALKREAERRAASTG